MEIPQLRRNRIYRRQTTLPPLPDCVNTCITHQSTVDSQREGGCAFTDTRCQCGSAAYAQPLYDCMAAVSDSCSHHFAIDDIHLKDVQS
ncbi:hypothetical protein M408DRAFT_333412 [Serendipita vermifera MAFF 305830]|uniref:CFEM domain-containing protein n=1 Tax=Serendipita vermifera MAFF 305830 TaxID=933852 RepID=A0A0C2WVS7_SERVB|nr:hypothetical protein M408DRAFT_333412 [Serendipita vermifera MAFF 305830]